MIFSTNFMCVVSKTIYVIIILFGTFFSPKFLSASTPVQVETSSLLDRAKQSVSASEWRRLAVESPVITSKAVAWPTETTIAGSIFIAWDDARLSYQGAKSLVLRGTGYPAYMFGVPAGGLTGIYNKLTAALEFDLDGSVFEIFCTGGNIRLWVDDAPLSNIPLRVGASAGSVLLARVDFGLRKTRRLRIEFSEGFGGLRIESSANFNPLPAGSRKRWMMVGDSFVEGTLALNPQFTGMAQLIRAKFGVDMVQSGSGGTGYINSGPTGRFNYTGRIQDVAAANPDLLIVFGSVNDRDDVTVATAGAYFDSLRALRPKMPIIVIGPSWKTAPAFQGLISRNSIAQACQERQIPFIDPIASGKEWFTPANTNTFYGGARATGTCILSSGGLSAVVISNPGDGYAFATAPDITISGNGGAVVQARMSYRLTAITLLSGGSDYVAPPDVIISGGGALSSALAVAEIQDGMVTRISVSNSGDGFTSIPELKLAGGGGRGAIATAALSGRVVGVDITSAGTYSSTPSITFSAPGDGTHPNQNGHDNFAERIAWEIGELLSNPVELDAGAEGLTYEWVKDGVALAGQDSRRVFFNQPGPIDCGVYEVKIGKADGSFAVRNFTLAESISYRDFVYRFFTSSEISDGNDSVISDYDGDGLVNILEYCLGLNPKSKDLQPLTINSLEGAMFVNYSRRRYINGVDLELQRSDDLVSWFSASPAINHVDGNSSSTAIFSHSFALANGAGVFFRLNVDTSGM